MIKAIVFDWGGVLIDDVKRKMTKYCAELLGVDEQSLVRFYSKYSDDFQKGNITEKEVWENICKSLKVSPPLMVSIWGKAFRQAYSPKKEMFDLAAKLRRNGYKIGLLSNCEPPTIEVFYDQKYNVFDETVFSCEEHTIKPEKKIYEIAIKRLGMLPEEILFIDNKLEFVEAAKAVGMKGIVFMDDIERLKKYMAGMGVNAE